MSARRKRDSYEAVRSAERSDTRFYGNMQESRERGLPVRWRREKSTPARKVEDLLPRMPDGED
jgi:hypothetical protein